MNVAGDGPGLRMILRAEVCIQARQVGRKGTAYRVYYSRTSELEFWGL